MVSIATEYGLSVVGTPYVWWTDGPVPDRGPAWAENAPPPSPGEVIAEGCFCADVPNLLLRAVGQEIPMLGDELYDGGCLAYGEYYSVVAEAFDPNEDYPEGTLIGRYFTWDRLANGDQGHVAVVLEDGYLLQPYNGDGYGYPGVNTDAPSARSSCVATEHARKMRDLSERYPPKIGTSYVPCQRSANGHPIPCQYMQDATDRAQPAKGGVW